MCCVLCRRVSVRDKHISVLDMRNAGSSLAVLLLMASVAGPVAARPEYYRRDGVRITHDPYAAGVAAKYGSLGNKLVVMRVHKLRPIINKSATRYSGKRLYSGGGGHHERQHVHQDHVVRTASSSSSEELPLAAVAAEVVVVAAAGAAVGATNGASAAGTATGRLHCAASSNATTSDWSQWRAMSRAVSPSCQTEQRCGVHGG